MSKKEYNQAYKIDDNNQRESDQKDSKEDLNPKNRKSKEKVIKDDMDKPNKSLSHSQIHENESNISKLESLKRSKSDH